MRSLPERAGIFFDRGGGATRAQDRLVFLLLSSSVVIQLNITNFQPFCCAAASSRRRGQLSVLLALL